VSESEAYLRELRRALPPLCRRRLLAEVREHFASAVAAEATRGVSAVEAERLTIARLGPAHALANQLLDDLRTGVLGPIGRFTVFLTTMRLALATVAAVATGLGVVVVGTRSSSTPPALPTAVPHGTALQADAAAAAQAAAAMEVAARGNEQTAATKAHAAAAARAKARAAKLTAAAALAH
jgi:hypothetical protein